MSKQNQASIRGADSLAKLKTSLAEAQSATDRAEMSFRVLVESVKDYAIFFLDPDGSIRSWNAGAERINGYSAEEAIGKHFSMFYTPEDMARQHPQYELRTAIANGRYEEEGWRVRKDGTRFWSNVVITSLYDEQGRHIGFAKVTRDLTEKKKADDALKVAYADLEVRVKARTQELTETNKKLQDAIQVRDEFLSIASHELRSPLTPLKLQIQTLISNIRNKNIAQMTDEKLDRMAQISDRAISRLGSLIDNLLDVSRINNGKLVLRLETLDLSEVIREVLERFRREIQESKSEVTFKNGEPIVGRFDHLRIEQVIINLLTNALKYGNRKPIQIELSHNSKFVWIEFCDRGIGISPEDRTRVFERFERAKTAETIGGLGLGLYITRQIVEAHGGTIFVEPREGGGSTFTVKIPLDGSSGSSLRS